MSDVTSPKDREPRSRQTFNFAEAIGRTFERWANALVVRTTSKGAPSYREDRAAARYAGQLATGAVPIATPNASAPVPGTTAGTFDLYPWTDACFFWRNVGDGTWTSIDVEFWAETDGEGWVRVAVQSGALPSVEYLVQGLGYRRVFVRLMAAAGGAGDTVEVLMAGA